MSTTRTLTASAATLLALGLTACGSPAPSAQCRDQVARIAAYETDANSLGSDVVSTDVAARFSVNVAASGALVGYVMGTDGHYAAIIATDGGTVLATCTAATLAGAATTVADRDRGLAS